MHAGQLMTRQVRTCSREDTLESTARQMWECDVGCVVVVDSEQRPIGVLTDRDVAMAAYTQGTALRDSRVDSAMSRQVKTCPPGASVRDLEDLMQSAQIRRIPVVNEQGKLMGLVSLGDLARSAHSGPLHMPSIPGVAKTLAKLSEPRLHPSLAAAE